MTLETHPLNRRVRPNIITRPQDRLAQDLGLALMYGRPSFRIIGSGRAGKTTAARILELTLKWRPYNIGFLRMVAGSPDRHTEGNFLREMVLGMGLKGARNANAQDSTARIIRAVEEEAGRADADLVIIVVESAELLTLEDYEHIAKVHNHFNGSLSLFFLFVCQNDNKRGGADDLASLAPPHIYGRYFVDRHVFTGLLWEIPEYDKDQQDACDVALALREYDQGLRHPHVDSPSASETFATRAFANGWRLEQERDPILAEIKLLCAQEELAVPSDWLMVSFEVFVYHVLVHVAGDRPDFTGLTRDDIRSGLRASAFAFFEHARQRVRK
ncbi:ATP-binding protein [Pseudoxanthomonas kaohsiungensis]|uniref:ATP-binding protein n=1 Tax=Pseudoxanthomonas kaohsiungensis TaxID=283923 RepID=A0ABW3LWH5_9GAMM|nr:ATP-binding protein [Pseudoxanthomonas kaohsiungensis]